ncbi:MAG: hypothetical protein IPP77_11470 [Bacteroidetes bacterium]|nr:hypothetical protein [Bacteroidota bacterium]
MNKEIYLIRGNNQETYVQFKNRIVELVSRLNKEYNPDAIKFTITEKAPPGLSIIPFSKKKVSVISIYKSNADKMDFIQKVDGFCGGYRVTEALPVAYIKNWSDGEPTPGACLLTLFSQKKSIDYQTFLNRWHNGHTPLSLRIHPLWNYVRNVVNEKLYANSEWFDGIVEEQVREESNLLNPFKFFGNPLIIIPRMITVYFDTKSFIDYDSMETYLASEYLIKTQ